MIKKLFLNLFFCFVLPAASAADFAVSEKDFFEVIKTLERSYTSFAKNNYQATLIFEKNWLNETINAQATIDPTNPKIWKVQVSGGMARAYGMTKDAFALVLCHELGHYMGGAPNSYLYGGWPSAEGQADYWATSKCLKKYFYELQPLTFHENSFVPIKATDDCLSVYRNPLEQKICIRSMMASLEFANFLNILAHPKVAVQFEAPDTRVVKGTNFNDYPRPQCRFDTLYQGALCPISFTQVTSDTHSSISSCTSYDIPGARPRCWFFPE